MYSCYWITESYYCRNDLKWSYSQNSTQSYHHHGYRFVDACWCGLLPQQFTSISSRKLGLEIWSHQSHHLKDLLTRIKDDQMTCIDLLWAQNWDGKARRPGPNGSTENVEARCGVVKTPRPNHDTRTMPNMANSLGTNRLRRRRRAFEQTRRCGESLFDSKARNSDSKNSKNSSQKRRLQWQRRASEVEIWKPKFEKVLQKG